MNAHSRRLALLVVVCALAAGAAGAEPRVLAVTGHGAISYRPDYVDLEFSVVARDEAYAAAQTRNLAAVEAAMGALTVTYGVKREDITTLAYNLAEEPVFADGKVTGKTYVSTTRMRVRVRDLGAYRAMIVSLLDAGVNGIDSIAFGVDDREALREKALAAAYLDAERMAKAIAAAGRFSLGKTLQVNEQLSNRPPVSPLAKAAFIQSDGSGEVISTGTQTVEADLLVEFELR